MRRYMMRIAEHFAKENDCLGLVTGESIGQVGRNGRDPPFFHQDIGAGRRACRAVTNDPAAENPLFH